MDLKEILSKKYNINIIDIEKNIESTDGNVYIIKTDKCKYVAKIYTSTRHTLQMIKLHIDLYNKGFYIPNIIKTKNRSNYIILPNNNKLVLYSFLKGYKISEMINNISSDTIILLARQLKKLHNNTKENIYKLDKVPFKVDKYVNRFSLLHFDLTKDNIFYNNKIGFIDFDDAKYGPSILDVSILIALLFISKSRGIDKDNIKLFIDTYYQNNNELKQKEIKLIKEYAIKWIDYTLNKQDFNQSIKNSFEMKKQLLELNSKIFEEILYGI